MKNYNKLKSLDVLIEFAYENAFKKIQLTTHGNLERTIRFYQKMEFRLMSAENDVFLFEKEI